MLEVGIDTLLKVISEQKPCLSVNVVCIDLFNLAI